MKAKFKGKRLNIGNTLLGAVPSEVFNEDCITVMKRWIFKNFAVEGNLILDTHLGSGSSRIAANKAGLHFVGCEISPAYFEAQEQRFKEFVSQLRMF